MTEPKKTYVPDSHNFEIIKERCLKNGFAEMMSKPGIFTKGKAPSQQMVDTTKAGIEFQECCLICINTGIDKQESGHAISALDMLRQEIMAALDAAEPKPPANKEPPKVEKSEIQGMSDTDKTIIRCPVCDGSTKHQNGKDPCPECKGKGLVYKEVYDKNHSSGDKETKGVKETEKKGVDETQEKKDVAESAKPEVKPETKTIGELPKCIVCKKAISHAEALDCKMNEDPFHHKDCIPEVTVETKNNQKNGDKKMNEVKEAEGKNVPARQETAKTPAKMSDHELDMKIEKEKAKRFLETQGGSYKVSGVDVPDSARIQNIANEQGVSVQILDSEQTDTYARVRVRGTLGNQFADGEVWIDFKTETQLLMMEFVNKNQGILDHFEGLNPVFVEGAKIKNYDGSYTDAKYALVHAMLTLKKFAIRSANTKASKIVQMKLLNKEFREKEEISDEQKEQELANESKKNRR